MIYPNKKGPSSIIAETLYCIVWAHLGMILGPPDYEGFGQIQD